MKQWTRVNLAVCVVVLAVASARAQMPQPFSADFSVTAANGFNKTGKFFFSAPKMRMDMTGMPEGRGNGPFGGNVSVIIDGAAKTTYMLMPQAQMYMEVQATGANDMQGMRNLQHLSGGDMCGSNPGATCKKVGSETVNGRSCDKWEMTDQSAHKTTAWVDQKLHFPIKMQEQDGTVTNFTNIKEGAQDASLFVVPPGYRKFDAGGLSHQQR